MSDTTTASERPKVASASSSDNAERLFSKSVVISGFRCFLTYLVFPFLTPLIGITSSTGAIVGAIFGLVAIVFNILSIRRFFASNHRYRWWASALNASVIVLLVFLFVVDSQTLLG